MKAIYKEQISYVYVRGISPFSGNPFSLLAISSFSLTTETEKDAKYHIKRQDIGIFDFKFPNLQRLRTITNNSRLVYINVFEFIERIYIILKDNFIVDKSKR